jgi:nucleotide-binding universal stress UspA family protein
MKRIMFATDFSEWSDRALRRAVILARAHDAVLWCCHVKSRIRQVVVPMVSQATLAADFQASNASNRW